jgi:orotate phosphoribosyltransferase
LHRHRQYDAQVARHPLIEHLTNHALRTDGPFTLRSGEVSEWYLDARQTTFDGEGAWHVGEAILEVLDPSVDAVGGLTMGADPIAVATALVANQQGRALRAFSVRKTEKTHGTGGRLVGPVAAGDRVAILEDTTTTGEAAVEAARQVMDERIVVVQAIALVDRSGGKTGARFSELGIPYVGLVTPADLGVS